MSESDQNADGDSRKLSGPAAYTHNLVTGKVTPVFQDQLDWEDKKTAEYKAKHGECNEQCRWMDGYGWVPECGCPVHDP